MKATFATIILFSSLAMGGALCAQTPDVSAPQHRPANPQQQLNHLTRKLALSADQQSQLLPILTDRDQQVSSINTDSSLTPKERHAKLVAVRNDAQSRLRGVLTDTQRAAYDQMQQEARERAKTKRLTSVSN
jgi:septal ring factor EnvC (AmiA/AmiB activator)